MDSIITSIQTYDMTVKAVIIICTYFFTFYITNVLIKIIITKGNIKPDNNEGTLDKKTIRDGMIIGKCENILVLSLILAGEVTGLALIIAAKNLARQKDIDKNAGFFLAGTMINLTASFIIAYGLKFTLSQLPF